MRSLRAEAHDLATTPLKVATASAFFLAAALDVMEVGAQEWELEWAWAQRIRERILSRTQEHDQDKREETQA